MARSLSEELILDQAVASKTERRGNSMEGAFAKGPWGARIWHLKQHVEEHHDISAMKSSAEIFCHKVSGCKDQFRRSQLRTQLDLG